MIDTIRFKIPINQEHFFHIRKKSLEVVKINHKEQVIQTRHFHTSVNIGSFNRDINIFMSELDMEYIYIEFSLPKFHYGHNIYLIYQSQLKDIITEFYQELKKHFAVFPDPAEWQIQRLDLCYAWKYRTQQQAEQILDVIRTFNYPRKKVFRYDSSVMYVGSSYTVKWYLKAPEYHKHDFRELKKFNIDRAYQLLGFAEGVLRFEVTLRKASFMTHFLKKKLMLEDLYNFDLDNLFSFFFEKSLLFSGEEFQNSTQIFQRLKRYCKSNEQVAKLYTYYLGVNASDPQVKDNIYNTLSRSQIYRNNQLLKKAGVTMLTTSTNPNFNLTFPSPYATSHDPSVTL